MGIIKESFGLLSFEEIAKPLPSSARPQYFAVVDHFGSLGSGQKGRSSGRPPKSIDREGLGKSCIETRQAKL